MHRLGRSQLCLQNSDLVKRLNIAVPTIVAAQTELAQTGLLDVRLGNSRGSEADRFCTYTFPSELTT